MKLIKYISGTLFALCGSMNYVYAQYTALDDVLLCKGWKNETYHFIRYMATEENSSKPQKTMEQNFKKNYKEDNIYKHYPNIDNEVDDYPDISVFVPKDRNSSLFSQIEFFNNYGYGFSYDAQFKNGIDIEKIKEYIQKRDNFKFSYYTKQQIAQHKKLLDILDSKPESTAKEKEREKLEKQFPYLGSAREGDDQLYVRWVPLNDFGFYSYIKIATQKGKTSISCGYFQ